MLELMRAFILKKKISVLLLELLTDINLVESVFVIIITIKNN